MEKDSTEILIDAQTGDQVKNEENNFKKVCLILSTVLLAFPLALLVMQPILTLLISATSQLNYEQRINLTYQMVLFCALCSLFAVIIKIGATCFFDREKVKFSALARKVLSRWELIALFLAFLWTLISCLVAVKQDIVWFGNWYNKEGFLEVLAYGIIFLDAYLVSSRNFKKTICYLLVLSGAIVGACLLVAYISGAPFILSPLLSIYRNSNHYGYALAVSTVLAGGLFLSEKKVYMKGLFALCFCLLHANLLVCDSLGALIGEIAGLVALGVFFFIKREKGALISLVILFGLFLVVSITFEASGLSSVFIEFNSAQSSASNIVQGEATGKEGSSRWGLWVKTIEVIKEVPLFGKGLDCYYQNNLIDPSLDMPHNEYLQIASNVGVPALIFYLVGIGGICLKCLKGIKKINTVSVITLCASVGYLVSALFGNTFVYTYPFMLIMLAFSRFE